MWWVPSLMPPFTRAGSCKSDPDPAVADALRWLGHSTEDLDVARVLLVSSLLVPSHVCWFAKQSAEKALEGVAFPSPMASTPFAVVFPGPAGLHNSYGSWGACTVGGRDQVPGRLTRGDGGGCSTSGEGGCIAP